MAIQFIGAAHGSNTCTVPAHQAGDLILGFAYRDGSTTAPAKPADFTNIANGGLNSNSARSGYKVAASGAESFGTWTNADMVVCLVYRYVNQSSPIGDSSQTGAASTTVTYPALSMSVTDGTSWVVGFSGHRSTDTSLENAPSGMGNRETYNDGASETAGHDTGGGVTSWSDTAVSVGGTSSGWRAHTIEIKATPTGAVNATLDNITLSSAATLTGGGSGIEGTSSVTLSDITLSSSGNLAISGQLSGALSDVSLSSAGALAISGELSSTLDGVTLSAAGTLPIAGQLSATIDDVTLSSEATLAISGQSDATLGDVTLSSAATLAITGTLDSTLDDVTLSARGGTVSAISAEVAVTLGDVTTSASGILTVQSTGGFWHRPRKKRYEDIEEAREELQEVQQEIRRVKRLGPVIKKQEFAPINLPDLKDLYAKQVSLKRKIRAMTRRREEEAITALLMADL